MTKLLNAFREKRDIDTARRLLAYDRRHPMASCLLAVGESDLLQAARAFLSNLRDADLRGA